MKTQATDKTLWSHGSIFVLGLTECVVSSDRPPDLNSFQIKPSASQILFQGDKLPFECEASAPDGNLTLIWVRNGVQIKENASLGVRLYHPLSPDRWVNGLQHLVQIYTQLLLILHPRCNFP